MKVEILQREIRNHSSKIIQIIESKETTDFPIGQKIMCSNSPIRRDPRNNILCHEGIYEDISIVIDSPQNRDKMDTVRSISLQVVQPDTDQKIYNKKELWNYPVERKD